MKHELDYWNLKRVLHLTTVVLLLVSAITLGFAKPAYAAEPPDIVMEFPAGIACDFDLRIEIWGSNQVYKEFTDKNGNLLRTLSAGSGNDLLFTNLSTGATYFLKAKGSVTQILYRDGFQQLNLAGHNVVILFPTDMPPGPSTILFMGRTIFTVDMYGDWTLQKVSKAKIDICATLN